jgi:predicted acylesterase/phospholipase RssA
MPTASQPATTSRHISSSSDRRSNSTVDAAEQILAGGPLPDSATLKALVRDLKTARYFDIARQLCANARPSVPANDTAWFAQQQALCTYKDPDLPADQRLDDALAILRDHLKLRTTAVQETLGLAGAIFKRKWEIDAQRQNLEHALAYYRKGYQQGILGDEGYTAINAAYVLDLLAAQTERTAADHGMPSDAARLRAEAQEIRAKIVEALAPGAAQIQSEQLKTAWFTLVTLGEAAFGLGDYAQALDWLTKARDCNPAAWELESAAHQLAEIARLQRDRNDSTKADKAWSTLQSFLGGYMAAANSLRLGKTGLALSGGGLRASLFHIGVLARLAECDLLRHVEVLSCVSGGSIVGAHYYLELRHLLQRKPDREITAADYVAIVERISENFLLGIQRNIRCRLMSEFRTNLKMALMPDYTSSQRLGELYEEEIYSRVNDGHTGPRLLNELIIVPEGEQASFNPKLDNWRRAAKVPILILNATTLNTGHNWQFTAKWMGETPIGITSEIDANDQLRRLYYWQAPEGYRDVRLGHAVAASACVPGLFEPLALPGIYPDRVIHLVDGGLHDNQGVASLIEQDCAIFLVSDATGQMQTVKKPRSEVTDLLMRMNSILMSRVRDAEYREIAARRKSSLIRGLMFLHLKKNLDGTPVGWMGAKPHEIDANAAPAPASKTTPYGVNQLVQTHLAGIRTDLDSFHDTEALALMASGYLMTAHELPNTFKDIAGVNTNAPSGTWRFLDLKKDLTARDADPRFERLLVVGCSAVGKAFRLAFVRATLLFLVPLLALIIAVGAIWFAGVLLAKAGVPIRWIAIAIVVAIGTRVFMLFRSRRKSITQFAFGMLYAVAGWLVRIHLATTDRLYLWLGRVSGAK